MYLLYKSPHSRTRILIKMSNSTQKICKRASASLANEAVKYEKGQYYKCTDKRKNCQISNLMGFAGKDSYSLIDRELYIPVKLFEESYRKVWEEEDSPRIVFRTKYQIIPEMLNKAFTSIKIKV